MPHSHGMSAPQATKTAPPSHFDAFESGGNSAAIVSLSLLHTSLFSSFRQPVLTFLHDVGRFRFRTSRHPRALRCPHPRSLGFINHEAEIKPESNTRARGILLPFPIRAICGVFTVEQLDQKCERIDKHQVD
jgi:hypothetical protein